jgi:hypothetical protein
MPLIQTTLFSILNPAVSPVPVYPSESPEGTLGAHIVYFRVSTVPANVLALNAAPITQTRFQIDVYADNYDAAQALAGTVKTAMAGASLQNVLISEQDMFEDGTRQHRVMLDYNVWG